MRVGIVGLGVMGSDHAKNVAAGVRGARLAAVSDADRSRADRLAAELDVPHIFDDGLGMIASGEIDGLIIATPDDTHARLVRAALEADLAILCEKPLAPTAEESADIVRLAESLDGHRLSMGFMRRFDQGYQALKQRIDAGTDGRLLMTQSVHRNVSAYPGQDSSATITNSAVHEFDILPWLSGSRLVRAQWTAGRASTLLDSRHDPQFIILHDESGILHTVQLQVHARYGYDVRCETVSEHGSAELAPVPALVEQAPIVAHSNFTRSTAYPEDWRPRFADAYRREIQAWVVASLNGAVPEEATTPREALESALVARAAVESMNSDSAIIDIPSAEEWLASV